MWVVWWASKINARACILDIQSFDRVAASKKPRVRSIAVSADAIGIEIMNLGSKGMDLRHFSLYYVIKDLYWQVFHKHIFSNYSAFSRRGAPSTPRGNNILTRF